jgi:hypothetical protein
MYNNGNSSKNVTGASVVDGTLENADFADNGLSGDKIDGGIISNFQSTGIDDRLPTGKVLTLNTTGIDVVGDITASTFNGTQITETDTNNLGLGDGAVDSITTGDYNVGVGWNAVGATTEGSTNTGLGRSALRNNVTGSNNIGIGFGAGQSITTGSSNTIIGAYNGTASLASTVVIAAGSTERLKADSTGLKINNSGSALDDYEEGVYEPALTTSGGQTYTLTSTQDTLSYTKIGNTVHVTGAITISTKPGGASGRLLLSLPFTVDTGIGESADNSVATIWINNTTLNCTDWVAICYSSNLLNIYRGDVSAVASGNDNNGPFSGNEVIQLSLTYKAI